MTSECTILLFLAMDFLKTEARILDFGDVGVRNMELVTEFTGDQMDVKRPVELENRNG